MNKKRVCLVIGICLCLTGSLHAVPTIVGAGSTITFDTDAATYTIDTGPAVSGSLLESDYGKSMAVFKFDSLELQKGSIVTVAGSNALHLIATGGDIVMDTPVDLSGGPGSYDDPGTAGVGGWEGITRRRDRDYEVHGPGAAWGWSATKAETAAAGGS